MSHLEDKAILSDIADEDERVTLVVAKKSDILKPHKH